MEVKPITKAVRSESNSYEITDVTQGITRRSSVKPGLITALLGGDTNDFSLTQDKVSYDELTETMQLPNGKRFDEVGGSEIILDDARELTYRSGSYGYSAKIKPADVSGKRKPFSEEVYTMADRAAEASMKMENGWALFEELSYAKVLSTDANYTFGGPAKSYNFYTDIYGSARPSITGDASFDFSGTATIEDQTNALTDQMQEECARNNTNYSSLVMLCGGTFFDRRFAYERDQAGNVLALNQTTLDLGALGVSRQNFDGDDVVFKRRHFTSALDGITYIRVPDAIGGQLLMGSQDNGFLIPVGADNMLARVYTPAQTKQYVNTVAMKKYAEYREHDRLGDVYAEECNVLYMNRTPKLIIPVTTTA